MSRLLIRNIGLLLSGDLNNPILDADTVLAVDGKIAAVGKQKDINAEGATLVIDAKGTTLAPGLIDSHVHPLPATGRRVRTRSAGSTATCTAELPP
jgi:enamidase